MGNEEIVTDETTQSDANLEEKVESSEDETTDAAEANETPPAVEIVAKGKSEIVELQSRLRAVSAAYQKQNDDMAAHRQRLQRFADEKEEMRRGEVVAGLFEPMQNLHRSLAAMEKAGLSGVDLDGLKMVAQQFMDGFTKMGLVEVSGKGSPFDPNFHEALAMNPVDDAALSDVVLEVFSVGYRIGNRLIIPAKVIVGQYTETES